MLSFGNLSSPTSTFSGSGFVLGTPVKSTSGDPRGGYFPTGASNEGSTTARRLPVISDPRAGFFPTGASNAGSTTARRLPVISDPRAGFFPTGASNEGSTKARKATFSFPALPTGGTSGGGILSTFFGDGVSLNDFTLGTPVTGNETPVPTWSFGTLISGDTRKDPNIYDDGILRASRVAQIPKVSTIDLDGGSGALEKFKNLAGDLIANIGNDDDRSRAQPVSFGGGDFLNDLPFPWWILLLLLIAAFYLMQRDG